MKPVATQALLVACILAFLLVSMPVTHAFDNSLGDNFAQSPTVNPQLLGNTLVSMSQQSNDTKLQQLVSQFNSSLSSGNTNLTAADLANLQSYLSSKNSSSGLSSLVQSLQLNSDGSISINPSTLSSLLKLGGSNGSPTSLDQGNLTQQISDLASLASLLQGVNPQLSQQFLLDANNLSLNSNISTPPFSPGSLGSLSSLKGLKSPSISSPKLASSGSPLVLFEQLLFPIIIVAICLALFALRGKLARLMSGQRIPGQIEEKIEPVPYDSTDPKKRIVYYFAKTIQFMKRKGVSKTGSDTHREFIVKCEGKSGSKHVRAISSLYEIAKFSGRQVTNEDANHAESELSSLENVEVKTS